MGIRKSKITPSINVDDMLKKAEISHEIETEKLDVDKRLKEICEIKETLLKIQQDLQDAIKAEGNASVVLKKAISNSNSIVEHFTQLQQLLNQSVKTWETILENHRSEQTKMLTNHESNIRKILKRNEGIWFSDFWMKVLVIFLLVYTLALGLVVYYVT